MIIKRLTPSIVFGTLFSLLLIANNSQADNQLLITDDGREVLLNDDGSWTFRSSDRFASSHDGRRIRLKEDGSWQYADDAPPSPREKSANLESGDKNLKKSSSKNYAKKGFKNTRVKTQTVFYVQLNDSSLIKATSSDSDISLIEIKDNNGKNYPVISIKPDTANSIIIRAKKSPTILDDARSMEITLKAGLFGIKSPVTLSRRIVDFDKKDVDGFD